MWPTRVVALSLDSMGRPGRPGDRTREVQFRALDDDDAGPRRVGRGNRSGDQVALVRTRQQGGEESDPQVVVPLVLGCQGPRLVSRDHPVE
jgi:hypothetical protein